MEQCKYAYMKIKKLLELQGATMNDVVRIMTYTTDVRFFQDALRCRGEAFGSAPIPASTFLVVSQLAWPNMAIEVDVMAMLAKEAIHGPFTKSTLQDGDEGRNHCSALVATRRCSFRKS